MTVINSSIIKEEMDKKRRMAAALGIIDPDEKITNKDLIEIDLELQLWNLSHRINSDNKDSDEEHRMMLQYGNLHKIRSVNKQSRIKNEMKEKKKEKGMLDRIIEHEIERSKAQKERDRKKEKELEKIKKKLANNEVLTEEEQQILDDATETLIDAIVDLSTETAEST